MDSKYKSLRLQISQHQWTPARLIEDKVPFSVRNSALFANRLAHAYVACIADFPTATHYNVAEWGACFGFLSYHFLEQLKHINPSLYQKTHLYITDHSQDYLTGIKKSNLFKMHLDKITFLEIDVTDIQWPKNTPLHFCFSAYVIDALDAIQVSYKDTQFNEIKVQSTFDPQITVLDTTQFPPIPITLDTIYTNFITKKPVGSQQLLQLLENTTETYSQIPLTPQISCLLEGLGEDEPFTANYPLKLNDHLTQVHHILEDKGVYCISDFGMIETHQLPPQNLVSIYRQSVFYAIWFKAIFNHSNHLHFDKWHTQNAEYHTQECLLKKGQFTQTQKTVFQEQFKDVGYEKISSAIDQISVLIPDQNYSQTINTILETLSTLELDDYFLNITLATQLVDDGYLKDAKKYAQKMTTLYKDSAAEAHRILGFIDHQDPKGTHAIFHFKKALMTLPDDTMTHAFLGMEYMLKHQFQEAMTHFKKAIQKAQKSEIPSHLLAIAICMRQLKQHSQLKDFVGHIEKIHTSHPSLISQQLIQKLHQQLK